MTADVIYRKQPDIVLREEADSWVLLFNPGNGDVIGVNKTGAAVWSVLDHHASLPGILRALREACDDLPGEAEADVAGYLNDLVQRGFITSSDRGV